MPNATDYVLGTHDDEILRLSTQHRVWRASVLAAWRRARFGTGQTILDVGCGPGNASVDLAELVGPAGRVLAMDRSRRFLDALETSCRQRGLSNVQALELDLDTGEFPQGNVDGAWCRWILTFVQRPRDVLQRLSSALKPGGVLVIHEYFDYSTWRTAPRCAELDEFVAAVMKSWRDAGGEPDIGLDLPQWLGECGFEIQSMRPIIEAIPPSDSMWVWLRGFVDVGRQRLVDLGYLTPERAHAIWRRLTAFESESGALMITPGVLELIAVRR